MTDLDEQMKVYLDLAKGFLEKGQEVATVAVFIKYGCKPYVKQLEMSPELAERNHAMVQAVILNTPVDAVCVISDAWMAHPTKEDRKKDYKRGWVEQQPNRTEALIVVGGSVEDGTKGLIQPYTRKGKKIKYGEILEQGTLESAFFDNAWEIRRQRAVKKAEQEVEGATVH